jgi:hypothetical protein
MPIKTDTGSSPYFDDFNDSDDFYKVLFKPSVPVQVRELNQLQSIVQKQIERFGDNIFKRGTIVDGCAFTFHDDVHYVKIKDTETDGSPVAVSIFVDKYVKNSANLQAYIITSNTGFETQDPDLNTLYLRYLNTGTNGQVVFESGEILTVFDGENSIYEVSISSGGSSFSNTDAPLFLSAIAVQNSTGGKSFTNSTGAACTFSVGQNLIGGISSANVIITGVDTTSNNDSVILTFRPQYNELTTPTVNAASWTILPNENISTNTVNNGVRGAVVREILGSGAAASIVTDGTGVITTMSMTNRGSGYIVPPYVTVISPTGTPSTLNIIAENYVGQITVSSLSNPIGTGYGFSVGRGVIYQLGYFARVDEQFIIVEKYSNTPDAKSVGFNTIENIINSNIDPALLDNALGTFNYTAPGADRLKLSPTLFVQNTSDAVANNEFFPIVEFSAGTPYKQNKYTAYQVVEQEMARRTFDESGNYVLDNFLATTVSSNTIVDEANTFDIVIDPGKAYISGHRVETYGNYRTSISKGTDTAILNNASTTVVYGNYIRVNNAAGVFLFSTGDVVSLRDTAKTFFASSSNYGSVPTAPGVEIGAARIRSMVYESGIPGSPDAVYRLYLFNITMNPGKNFKNIRSVFYDGASYDAVADIVLNTDVTPGLPVAQLQDTTNNTLMFYTGADAVKDITGITYQYRTQKQTGLSSNTQGKITVTLSDASETHPYIGNLTSNEKEDVIIIPLANAEQSTTATGTVVVTTSANSVTANATTAFLTEFAAGDYVKISANSSGGSNYRRISSITNSTYLTLDSAPTFANVASTLTLAFPQFAPIPFSTRTNRTGNVSVNGKTLTLDLGLQTGNTLTGNVAVAVAYNVKVTNATPITKTANRDLYVRINCANSIGNTTGPWCIGVPDIFRLKNVYLGGNTTFLSTDSGVVDITRHFVIDHNQKSNEYNVGYLYIKPTERYTLSSADRLLVKFDAFTAGAQDTLFCVSSYSVNNSTELASLTTAVNTVEIPETVTSQGMQIDLRDYFDFRPVVANTVVLATSQATAPVHPPVPVSNAYFGNTSDPANILKFPVPDSDLVFNIEYYLGRKDIVTIGGDGVFNFIKGSPALAPVAPSVPADSLVIDVLNIPPYPSLPGNRSANTINLLNKRIINQKELINREAVYTVRTEAQLDPVKYSQTPAFTMRDIKSLQNRIEQLEYYSTLSLTEDKVKNEFISSSANSQLDRFKFGYFVDNFTTTSYADLQDIEFNATTNADRATLVPNSTRINFKYTPYGNTVANSTVGNIVLLPYESVSVVSQLQATTTRPGIVDQPSRKPTPGVNKGKINITPSSFRPHQKASTFAVFALSAAKGNYPNIVDTSKDVKAGKTLNKAQAFDIEVTGLRASTVFTFYFDRQNKSANCKPRGGKKGGVLKSNAQGILSFTFFLEYLNAIDLIDISVISNSPYKLGGISGMPAPIPLFVPPPGAVVSSDKAITLYQGSTVVASGVIPVKLTFDK